MYLGRAGSLLLNEGFLQWQSEGYSSCGAQASLGGDFARCKGQALSEGLSGHGSGAVGHSFSS